MFKKTLITLLIIFILTFQISFSYQKAQAASFADVSGYSDELVKGVLYGVAVVVGAAAHAQENVQDNVRAIYDSAVSAYNSWSPEYKADFIRGLEGIEGGLTIAGGFIEDLLVDYMTSDSGLGEAAQRFTVDGIRAIRVPYNHSITLSLPNRDVSLSATSSNRDYYIQASWVDNAVIFRTIAGSGSIEYSLRVGKDITAEQLDAVKKIKDSNLSAFLRVLSTVGGSYTLTDLASNTVIDLTEKNVDKGIKDFYDSSVTNGLTLGLPKTVPYTGTGQRLDVGEAGLTLDGVPYNGEVLWRDVTDAGVVLPVPELSIDGVPVYNVDGTLVDSLGNVIPQTEVSNVTAKSPAIEWVDGVPYVLTSTGVLINLLTGEVVGGVDIPVLPDVPVVGAGQFNQPTQKINWNPLLMSGQGLMNKFPFSIPFDFARQLRVFDVSPQAPKFNISIPNYFEVEGQRQSMQFELSFEKFDAIGTLFRWFILIIFDIGLILAIRKLLPE